MAEMTLEQHEAMERVLREVVRERIRQHARWGEQNLPDGTGGGIARGLAERMRLECQGAFARGSGTYSDILLEEVYEALAESDPEKLRAELVQVAAVCTQWCEAIDRRGGR